MQTIYIVDSNSFSDHPMLHKRRRIRHTATTASQPATIPMRSYYAQALSFLLLSYLLLSAIPFFR
jgi:hypothetical protein